MLCAILVEIGPVVLEEKITDTNGRWTTSDQKSSHELSAQVSLKLCLVWFSGRKDGGGGAGLDTSYGTTIQHHMPGHELGTRWARHRGDILKHLRL